MSYFCIAGLGGAAGLSLPWPWLIALATILAIATGVAGAIHAQPLLTVLMDAGVAVLVLDMGFVASVLLGLAPSFR
ncbi:hypothetical protein OPKNFCMD_0726 [Methylobacterium crusticola]|uniref:Uncharacterized protein n=1 Tax=Methylobacterium crusticola TaxID=1697972 RepID=A0ABQ4QRS2_9HYPH|nr:hypothetical protein [Methylobacterium crusticola]GJD48012.1 hypothetical protein OPKNFCMD_0726 [Methylobacterium crusticola]